MPEGPQSISNITLDESTGVPLNPDIDHERKVAIFDLLEENSFSPVSEKLQGAPGPYDLTLSIVERRLVFDIKGADGTQAGHVLLALSPFRRIVRDYWDICESYYQAIKTASPAQIEAIDMGRRGLHNEGSTLLQERLAGKIEVDHGTARRLFMLICVLHLRG